ncbi:MAG: hypothetical protein V1769_07200 [Thermoplasmatota archaeon]
MMSAESIKNIKTVENEAQRTKDQAKQQAEHIIEQAKRSIQKQQKEMFLEATQRVETMKQEAAYESATDCEAIMTQMKKDIKNIQQKARKNIDKAVDLIIDNILLEE